MKKNKGFTLVELLAVIVVLALIMIIAIPAILEAMENARKQSFYLYANSVYQKAMNKYVNDVSTKGSLDCSVFKLPSDLDISNGGDYVGWVMVRRKPVNSGNVVFNQTISNPNGVFSIKYCTKYGGNCNPDVQEDDSTYQSATWDAGEDDKGRPNTSTTIKLSKPAGYKLCYKYQYPDDSGKLQKYPAGGGVECVDGTAQTCNPNTGAGCDNYEFEVILTMKDKNRAVEGVMMKDAETDESFKKTFYDKMDEYANIHKTELSKLPITELTCSGVGSQISDPGVDPNKTTQIGTTETTTTQVQVTVATTTERVTTEAQTTRIEDIDDSILLQSLSVSGYNINYTPTQLSYDLTVPYNTEALSISYQTKHADSQVQLLGADNINVGRNTITVHVFNDTTGKSIDYHLYVMRLGDPNQSAGDPGTTQPVYDPSSGLPDPSLASSNAKLANITISRYQLADVFNPDVFNYDIEIDEGVTELTMSPITQSTEATYTIDGNSNLTDGSKVRIVVRSGNGYYTNMYEITVHIKKKTKTSTVVLRTIAVGLAVVLAALMFIMRKQKLAENLLNKKNEQNNQQNVNQGGYVQPTQINNNNNNQGNV